MRWGSKVTRWFSTPRPFNDPDVERAARFSDWVRLLLVIPSCLLGSVAAATGSVSGWELAASLAVMIVAILYGLLVIRDLGGLRRNRS